MNKIVSAVRPGSGIRRYTCLITMKLTVLLFLVGMLQVHARTFGQTVSLSKENAQLVDFFRTIQNQTDYHVICSSDILSEAPAIAINLKKVPLRQALSEVLNPLDLAFE